MLGKLMKYEWKNTAKIVSIILLVVAGATLVGIVGMVFPIRYIITWENGASVDDVGTNISIGLMTMTAAVAFFICVFSMVGVNYALYGYLSVRFYKTMYTDEGYLTHTLPLRTGEILRGKTIVAVAWAVILNLCVALATGILLGMGAMAFNDVLASVGLTNLSELARAWPELKEELVSQGLVAHAVHFVLAAVITVFVTPFGTLLTIFGGLSIGQLSRKHKLLLGILTTVGLFFLHSVLSQILRVMFNFAAMMARKPTDTAALFYIGTLDAGILTSLIMGSLMYFVTYQILSKKLNLE